MQNHVLRMPAVVLFSHRMTNPGGSFVEEKFERPGHSSETFVALNEVIKTEQHSKVAVLCCQGFQFPKFILNWNAYLALAFKNGREATGQPSVRFPARSAQRDGWRGSSACDIRKIRRTRKQDFFSNICRGFGTGYSRFREWTIPRFGNGCS